MRDYAYVVSRALKEDLEAVARWEVMVVTSPVRVIYNGFEGVEAAFAYRVVPVCNGVVISI